MFALTDLKENLSLNNEELIAKENDLKTEISRIEKEIEKSKHKFIDFENLIRKEFANISDRYAGQVSVKGDDGQFQTVTTSLAQELSEVAARNTQIFFDKDFLQTFHLSLNYGTFAGDMQGVINMIDMTKTALTAVATAWVCPLTGAANAGEAVAGAAGKKAAGSLAKKGAIQVAGKATKKIITLKVLGEVGKIMDQINPIEHLGNFLGQKYVSSRAFEEFGASVEQAATNLCLTLNYEMDRQLFTPLQENLQQIRENIKNVRRKKDELRQDLQNQKEQMIIDEGKLKQIVVKG